MGEWKGEGWKRGGMEEGRRVEVWKDGSVEGWKRGGMEEGRRMEEGRDGRGEGWNGDRVCKVFGMYVVFIAILRTTYILIIAVAHSSLIVLLGCVKLLREYISCAILK